LSSPIAFAKRSLSIFLDPSRLWFKNIGFEPSLSLLFSYRSVSDTSSSARGGEEMRGTKFSRINRRIGFRRYHTDEQLGLNVKTRDCRRKTLLIAFDISAIDVFEQLDLLELHELLKLPQ
jgi:hypothetical protein